jgi:hypothetical protein
MMWACVGVVVVHELAGKPWMHTGRVAAASLMPHRTLLRCVCVRVCVCVCVGVEVAYSSVVSGCATCCGNTVRGMLVIIISVLSVILFLLFIMLLSIMLMSMVLFMMVMFVMMLFMMLFMMLSMMMLFMMLSNVLFMMLSNVFFMMMLFMMVLFIVCITIIIIDMTVDKWSLKRPGSPGADRYCPVATRSRRLGAV